MAVFEHNTSPIVPLDDTVPLTCTIERAFNVKDHTEYTLCVQRGPVPEHHWSLQKRFSDFTTLDAHLSISGVELPLPPKKMFGNMDREFIAERQQGLQQYMDAILKTHLLASNLHVKKFLDEENYKSNLQEVALQDISMLFRSETLWDVIEPLPDIGWRCRKQYFVVHNKSRPKSSKFLLSWCPFGPDKFLSEKDLRALMQWLPTVQHPYLYPLEFATINNTSGISIHKLDEKGSLRDVICKAWPKTHYLKKYGTPKMALPCVMEAIQLFGKQILSTLKYLHDKGLPYGHLHASNVIVENCKCRLLNIENSLLGIPSFYRSYFSQFRKIKTVESIDVYCFGHVLYEMAFGQQLTSATCDYFSSDCPAEVRSVLESILMTEACKNGLPTVSDLLQHPLFRNVVLPPSEKPQMKIPSRLKEALKAAKHQMEHRLRDEQKLIHKCQRLSKAQAFHMSEEEKKKRKRNKIKRLSSQMNGQSSDEPMTPVTPTVREPPSDNAASNLTSSAATPSPTAPPSVTSPQTPINPPTMNGSCGLERGALLDSITGFSKTQLRKSPSQNHL
ncbi:PX domain-containing protein kinase-like protein [Lamellibrachia satsuma]|nr:PX domain-containing protein kinase-like protein [Lamellibrachia satsuma]